MGTWIHHINIDFLIVNDAQGVDEELGVESIMMSLPVL